MANPNESIRNAAVDKITHIRNHGAKAKELIEEGSKNRAICRFEVTQINCKAQSYHNIANINAEKIAEPPLLQSLSLAEIQYLRSAPLKVSHPCHDQTVERHIKLVTEASSVTAGFASRDGLIRQRIKSKHLMKRFDTKKQFAC